MKVQAIRTGNPADLGKPGTFDAAIVLHGPGSIER